MELSRTRRTLSEVTKLQSVPSSKQNQKEKEGPEDLIVCVCGFNRVACDLKALGRRGRLRGLVNDRR